MDYNTGRPYPTTAQNAIKQASIVVKNLQLKIKNKDDKLRKARIQNKRNNGIDRKKTWSWNYFWIKNTWFSGVMILAYLSYRKIAFFRKKNKIYCRLDY